MKPSVRIYCLVLSFVLGGIISAHSQEREWTVADIHRLISQDSLEEAKMIAAKNLQRFKRQKDYDSIYKYIQFEGSIKLNRGQKKEALQKAEALVELIKANASPHYVVEALTELGWIYDEFGLQHKAYKLLESAIPFANRNK